MHQHRLIAEEKVIEVGHNKMLSRPIDHVDISGNGHGSKHTVDARIRFQIAREPPALFGVPHSQPRGTQELGILHGHTASWYYQPDHPQDRLIRQFASFWMLSKHQVANLNLFDRSSARVRPDWCSDCHGTGRQIQERLSTTALQSTDTQFRMLVDVFLPPFPPVSRVRFGFRLRRHTKHFGKLLVLPPCGLILQLDPVSGGLPLALGGLRGGLLASRVVGVVKS